MRGNSSPELNPWWEIPLQWPIEHVACQLEVVEPRRLTALEWAVLRVMEAFSDTPPTLQEMAEELGLGEPRFLLDVLRALVSQEALELLPGVTKATELEEVRFTTRGLELFRKGQVDGEPSTVSHGLCFDLITEESLPVDTLGTPVPECPVSDPSGLPAPRGEVGLERLREIVQRLGPPVGGADARIRSVRVLTRDEAPKARAGFSWVKHPLALVPTPEGRLQLHTPSLTAMQREQLTQYSLEQWVTPSQAVTHDWAPHPAFRRRRQSLGTSSTLRERLVPIAQAVQEAKRLVAAARTEVLLHATWAAAPGLTEALSAAANRGVAVYVLGAESTGIRDWSSSPRRAPGFVVEAMHADKAPGALVVDGCEALLLDEVTAEVEELGTYSFEFVEKLRDGAAALGTELRRALLKALPATGAGTYIPLDVRQQPSTEAVLPRLLEEPVLRLDLARLALHPTPQGWAGIEAWVSTRCPGVDRITAIQQLADLVNQLVPDAMPAPWRGAGAMAWRTFHQAIVTSGPQVVPDSVLRALIDGAPSETTPEAVLDPLIAHWVQAMSVLLSVAPLTLLGRLRAAMDRRWPGAASRSQRFIVDLEVCLEVTPTRSDLWRLAESARLVATIASAEQARTWAWAVVAIVPAPLRYEAFEDWRKHQEPLFPLLGPALKAHHTSQWRALIAAAPARTEARLSEHLYMSQGLLEPAEAITSILALPASEALPSRLDQVVLLRRTSQNVWKQSAPNDETWNRQLQALLPISPREFLVEEHGSLVEELSRRLQGWPGADLVLRRWTQALLAPLALQVLAEGMSWWLESLRGVAGILGPDLERTASPPLLRHMGALRDARKQASPLWERLTGAWEGLGLTRASLEALVEPPTPPPAVRTNKSLKQRKKEKRR
ncbi:hypothetical protein ACN469_05920 [Corallococcus terminator]